MNEHRAKLYFDDGSMSVRIICPPGGGCEQVNSCAECGSHGEARDPECPYCEDVGWGECWLKQWAEASDPADVLEWFQGEVTIEVNGVWEGDAPLVEVYEPDLAHTLARCCP